MFRVADQSRVRSLTVERSGGEVTVTLRLIPIASGREITVRFLGATQVRSTGDRLDLTGIALILAEDMSIDGWQDVRFRVWEAEDALISLYCRDIERVTSDDLLALPLEVRPVDPEKSPR